MTTATLVPGIYNSTPPTLDDGEQAQLQIDVAGNLKTADAGLDGVILGDSIRVQGDAAGTAVFVQPGGGAEFTVNLGGTDNAVLDAQAASLALLDDTGVGEYETVAASQTAQTLGPTGATGDWLEALLVVPATTSPGNVIILDNATSITVFAGGASSVTTLHPFTIMVRARSVSGAWKVTTGSNVSVFATGNFT